MKRPSFQFYPGDWRNNANLRRCSFAARGAWVEILGVLHDSDEYGVCRWSLADISRAAAVPLKLARELADKSVLKGGDSNVSAFTFTPRHGGQDGETVTLIEASETALWYSSRMVRDEYIRQRRGFGTRFDSENQPPKAKPKSSPTRRIGDGPSSSSSSSSSKEERGDAPAPFPESEIPSWEEFWGYCQTQDCLLPAEWFVRDKFQAAEQDHWKGKSNWKAYARRAKGWWEADGRPMQPKEKSHANHRTTSPDRNAGTYNATRASQPISKKFS